MNHSHYVHDSSDEEPQVASLKSPTHRVTIICDWLYGTLYIAHDIVLTYTHVCCVTFNLQLIGINNFRELHFNTLHSNNSVFMFT